MMGRYGLLMVWNLGSLDWFVERFWLEIPDFEMIFPKPADCRNN